MYNQFKIWFMPERSVTLRSIIMGFVLSSVFAGSHNFNTAGNTESTALVQTSKVSGQIHESALPVSVFTSVKNLYTGNNEYGLISFNDGLEITFSGSQQEITLQKVKEVFNENKELLHQRYGKTALEDLKNRISFVAHSHPQNARPKKNVSLIVPPKAIGPSFTASDADFNFIRKTGIQHYIIDQTTIALIDKDGNFVNSWWWRDDGTAAI